MPGTREHETRNAPSRLTKTNYSGLMNVLSDKKHGDNHNAQLLAVLLSTQAKYYFHCPTINGGVGMQVHIIIIIIIIIINIVYTPFSLQEVNGPTDLCTVFPLRGFPIFLRAISSRISLLINTLSP